MVERLALAKAQAVAGRLQIAEPAIVIGADTVVVLDDDVLGKPRTFEIARAMLYRLSGREHAVITGVAVPCSRSGSATPLCRRRMRGT